MTDNEKAEMNKKYKYTSLHIAAESGTLEDLKELATNSPNLNRQTTDDCGYTPLMLAAKANRIDAVEILINAGANVLLRNEYSQSAYDIGLIHNNPELNRVLKNEENIQEQKKYGLTQEEMIKMLALKVALEAVCYRTGNTALLEEIQTEAVQQQTAVAKRFWQKYSVRTK